MERGGLQHKIEIGITDPIYPMISMGGSPRKSSDRMDDPTGVQVNLGASVSPAN